MLTYICTYTYYTDYSRYIRAIYLTVHIHVCGPLLTAVGSTPATRFGRPGIVPYIIYRFHDIFIGTLSFALGYLIRDKFIESLGFQRIRHSERP